VDQVIEIVLRPGSIEIRFGRRRLRDWWRRRVGAWREDRHVLRLAELDARTLKDIGLEQCIAARVHAYQRQEQWRLAMLRQGLM